MGAHILTSKPGMPVFPIPPPECQWFLYNKSCIVCSFWGNIADMALNEEFLAAAELNFEGDSLEVLSAFPSAVKQALGFALRQLQIGREPPCQTRSMSSVGPGVYELKESDERTWYRAIYLAKVRDVIHVLHCFEKDSRKTDRRDIEVARQRLKMVKQRVQERRAHEKRSG